MPLAFRVSTSANPSPMISHAFIDTNYEVLESLLREHKGQMRNEDLPTELDYFSKEYDKEREMEPRSARVRETTLVLHMVSEGLETERKGGSKSPSLLAAYLGRGENGQTLHTSRTFIHGGHQTSVNTGGNLPPNIILPMPRAEIPPSEGTSPIIPMEDVPHKLLRAPATCSPILSKTLPEYGEMVKRVGSILNYEDLKAKLRSHFSQQKKFMKTHLALHNIKQREGESTRAFVTRYTDDTL
ncbi:hypothetical protein Tco_0717386 [Tanacetum coccineum]